MNNTRPLCGPIFDPVDFRKCNLKSSRASKSIGLVRDGIRNVVAPALFSLLAWAVAASTAHALPQGGQVVSGDASVTQTSSNRLDITQRTDRGIIDWQSFGIGAGEHVHFQQPSAQSVTLNRVVGPDVSSIFGRLTANGNVFLVNPNGILFAPTAQVDVAGLVASTANVRNQDFMAGRYQFDQLGAPTGTIVNRGTINIADGGLVALVAPGVENSGVISARLGRVALAAGDGFTLDFFGDQLVSLAVSDDTLRRITGEDGDRLRQYVNQSGEITADGGRILLAVGAAREVVDQTINLRGVVRARSVENRRGEIVLSGGTSVDVSGVLDASGPESGQTGGTVHLLGKRILVHDGARIDVSGIAGGGTALIGGAFRGRGTIPNASTTVVSSGASILADAITNGGGGKIVVWADGTTLFSGYGSAKGGAAGGEGGTIEISGKGNLTFRGGADASAPHGPAGTVLFDPTDLKIGVGLDVEPTAIAEMLRAGTNVTQIATNDLFVMDRIDGRGGAAGAKLALNAGRNVAIDNDILTNHGDVEVNATAGTIIMGQGSASTITQGKGTAIVTDGGNVTMTAGGTISVQHLLNAGGVSITSTSNAADTVTVDLMQRLVTAGPVVVAGRRVQLRHSIFTNGKNIELGQVGGMVILNPEKDEVLTATASDAVTLLSDPASAKLVPTSGRIGRTNGDGTQPVPAVTVNMTSRQITLDSDGGDILLRGEVDIDSKFYGKTGTFVVANGNFADQAATPSDFVTFSLAAGAGEIVFSQGLASGLASGTNRAADLGIPINGSPDFDKASTNTVDLEIRSAKKITALGTLYVNSLTPKLSVVGSPVIEIFHSSISVEDSKQGLPPAFPAPAQPGAATSAMGGVTVFFPPEPPPPVGNNITNVINSVDPTSNDNQSSDDNGAIETAYLSGGRGVGQQADLGQGSADSGPMFDVFQGGNQVVEADSKSLQDYKDNAYLRRDAFGHDMGEDNKKRKKAK